MDEAQQGIFNGIHSSDGAKLLTAVATDTVILNNVRLLSSFFVFQFDRLLRAVAEALSASDTAFFVDLRLRFKESCKRAAEVVGQIAKQ